MLQATEQQHLAPGIADEIHHHLGHDLAQQGLVQRLFHPAPGQLGLGPAFFGIAGALFEQLGPTTLVRGEGQEVRQQLGKDRRVVAELAQQPLHHLFDTQVQAVTLVVVTAAPAHGCGGDFIEQAPGWMAATAEEALVQHRHLEHGDLQAADQRLERVRQVAVVKDAFEQHRDQVDHVFVGHIHHSRLAALDADPGQQLLQLVAQVEIVLVAGWRHVLLQVREQAQQVAGGNRQGLGTGFQGRRHTAAHMEQQGLQGSEDFLDAFVEGMLSGFTCAALASLVLDLGVDPVRSTPRRGRQQVGEDAGGDQQLVGLGIELLGLPEHVALEQLEDDQLDLDLHPQAAPGLQEIFAEQRRPQGVLAFGQAPAQQYSQACGQVPQGEAGPVEHPGHHGLHGDGLFQVIAGGLLLRVVGRGMGDDQGRVVLDQACEGLEELLEKAALDALALQAQVAHGLEQDVLLDVVLGPVGHLEQGVVGVIEQLLQAMAQLLGGLVTNLKQNHRQAGQRRSARLICSGLVQRHYIPVVVHPRLLQRCFFGSISRSCRAGDAHNRL